MHVGTRKKVIDDAFVYVCVIESFCVDVCV